MNPKKKGKEENGWSHVWWCRLLSLLFRGLQEEKLKARQYRTSSRPAWIIYLESVSKENVKKKERKKKPTWDIAPLVSAGEAHVKPGIWAPVLKTRQTKTISIWVKEDAVGGMCARLWVGTARNVCPQFTDVNAEGRANCTGQRKGKKISIISVQGKYYFMLVWGIQV